MTHIKDQAVRFVLGGNKAHKVLAFIMSPISNIKKRKLIEEVITADYECGIASVKANGPELIVSLTSYPTRFKYVTLALKSILLQDYKPDRIIMWYDCADSEITKDMRDLERYGIEYRHINDNIKPHKKYYWVMQEFPDSVVITVDDDIIYPKDTIRSLVNCYAKHPNCVCARRVHKMKVNQGRIESYLKWGTEYISEKEPSMYLCATGAGGVLYPPKLITREMFDINKIKDYCLEADDIWLKYMEILSDVPVIWAENDMVRPPIVPNSQDFSLSKENVISSRNDVFISKLNHIYGDTIERHLK